MDKAYNHKEQEPRIYQKWENAGVFTPEKSTELREKNHQTNKKEHFSVLMPPPNANAPLHCGHATYSIQDLMCRYKRMQGYKTVYLPGTDHAGFETQVVYEKQLKKDGKSRFDFDRETLYNDILNFVKENSGVAIEQFKKLGIGADWSRNTFMLDPFVIDTVYNTFIKMHTEGLIYRDNYMVNYSPIHGTTFSNLETEHIEQNSPLYYVKYKLEDSDEFITVATVRPETIPADVAIAVNPKDAKYKKFVGKNVINPLNNRKMSVIADDYVDMEFGTGALKITPAHDFNDFEIGKKHGLEIISSINLEGKMTKEAGPELEGLFATKARVKSIELLQSTGALEKVDEKYINNVLVDYKDKKPIEPMLLQNWFVKMESFAKKAIEAVEKGHVKYNQPVWKKETLRWLENIKDWPISRQIVFGIRIPVWYQVSATPNIFVVFLDSSKTRREGLLEDFLKEGISLKEINLGLQKIMAPSEAKYVISKECPGEDYLQETDTFDTWFSSGQWPLTTTKYPNGTDFKDFFPTSFLDSMWDILFFWLARMIMLSLYLTGEVPFKQVYIHGTITDANGQKMSKSKGNVINPLEFIEKYGADALRMGIMVGGNTAAKTTALTEGNVKGYRNFANKIWNMARFISMMFEDYEKEAGKKIEVVSDTKVLTDRLQDTDKEILTKLENVIKEVDSCFAKYRIMDAGETVYQFMWHEVADIYIEHVKTREDKEVALAVLNYVFLNSLKLLHPFMPFVTEAVWEQVEKPSTENELLSLADWPRI